MENIDWMEEFPAAITVCDKEGKLLALNTCAAHAFASEGGKMLVGRSMLDCHPPAAREKLNAMLAEGKANIYTIEKNGARTLIYQTPWYQDGTYAGMVELELPLPPDMPHFVRG
jgi:transcriptional regulator with PAS, ATPase and Fis domain